MRREQRIFTKGKKRAYSSALFCAFSALMAAFPAYAQEADGALALSPTPLLELQVPSIIKSEPSVRLDLGQTFLSNDEGFRDLYVPFASSILGSDLSGSLCGAGPNLCAFNNETLGLNYSKNILADKPGGVDVQFTPRAALSFGEQHNSALVGAIVKIGEDLREIDPNDKTRWYLFAGADAEALTYNSDSASRLARGQFNLQEKIIVGDAQAGFGYKIGDADISLAYIHRDVNSYGHDDAAISYTEDAAALSLTWKR